MTTDKPIMTGKATAADPNRLRVNDGITGRQRQSIKRVRRAQASVPPFGRAPDVIDGIDIRGYARATFPTNDTIKACRSASELAVADRAARDRQGTPGRAAPVPWRQRWGAYLLATGSTRLTAAQKRAIRRRLTRAELLELTDWDRKMLGVTL